MRAKKAKQVLTMSVEDSGYGPELRRIHHGGFIIDHFVSLNRKFKDGDKVRVTVELLRRERGKA